jgi:tRNA pseudouridine38-40 synthase
MAKYVIELSYDGAGFCGWQSQPGGGGVQDAIGRALAGLGELARTTGAGRTDAGVHARAQVAHFEAAKDWAPRRLVLALNARLPQSVSVIRAARAPDDFDARRSAVSREYRYFIWNSPVCYPHIRPFVHWRTGSHYDWARASSAVSVLVGRHDFRAFCRREDRPGNTTRTVLLARLIRRGRFIVFRITADAYLTNMVRMIVGSLEAIAAGRRDEFWLTRRLEGDENDAGGAQTAPASGLFLWRVNYGMEIFDR